MSTTDLSEARDRRWIAAVAAGDEDAFRDLFARYAPIAMALARRVVRHPHLAEEIVQEAFLSVWRHPDAFDPQRGSVRSWLLAMVHHRAVDAVRREESQRRRADDAAAGLRDEGPIMPTRWSRRSSCRASAARCAPRSRACPTSSGRSWSGCTSAGNRRARSRVRRDGRSAP